MSTFMGAACVVGAPIGNRIGLFVGEGYLEAKPALTGVAPTDPPGAAARASLARLFDVPVERVAAAAAQAASAHEGLEVVGAPFAAWLRAFGLPWIGESGAEPVTLRPAG
ncbi:hypothetical protein [Spirilliplanes yamanashiensis]|uniref:Uncharacterized protein n=1 Tax=Spirilliplanes yamanashiensis TaxID=42233 RepID=A0A8J4DMA6_9ACTN|nr:hypothetical protein [Spirilliplanes yamanashiensis]MDP9816715.1 hypothetical protein [Spirilliplanes yamanashiensis]GIJ06238.1 hypothetical protein Sya03_55900 [Spirilliplanes yamanashiensis]